MKRIYTFLLFFLIAVFIAVAVWLFVRLPTQDPGIPLPQSQSVDSLPSITPETPEDKDSVGAPQELQEDTEILPLPETEGEKQESKKQY